MLEPERPQMTIWHVFAWWIIKATRTKATARARAHTHTHTYAQRNMLYFLLLCSNKWFRERASLLLVLFVNCLSFVSIPCACYRTSYIVQAYRLQYSHSLNYPFLLLLLHLRFLIILHFRCVLPVQQFTAVARSSHLFSIECRVLSSVQLLHCSFIDCHNKAFVCSLAIP